MKKIKKSLKIGFFIFGMVMISGCGNVDEEVVVIDKQGEELVENEKICNVDSDCVPASCCHAIDVVNKENAPSCENLKCTASCETILDCGQGKPVCREGQCEIEVNSKSDLRGKKSRGLEEIKDVKSEVKDDYLEYLIKFESKNRKITKEDCDFISDKESFDREYTFNNLNFVEKSFGTFGWCLYKKDGNNYKTVGFGDNHRGIEPMAFVQNKYLIYGEGCGTVCYFVRYLNIYNYNKEELMFVQYSELSDDNKWLIKYNHYFTEKENDDEYLASAINLNNFETINFAKNNCLNKDCDFIFDFDSVDLVDNEIKLIDNKNGILKVPFINKKTGEKIYRTFDMKNNFKEI